MRQENTSVQKKLKQYSLLVAPVLTTAGMANAQVEYHDVDPDIFYKDSIAGDNYTSPVFLDLDGNGVYDVEFAAWSSVQSNNGPNIVNLAAARQYGANGNAIMGYTNLFSATFCSTPLAQYCPSALNQNEVIGPGANFWAVPSSGNLGTLVRNFNEKEPPNNFIGQWNNLNDSYMGVRFWGGDGNLHYGWIRMDVSKSPTSITIKDFAYETQNGVSIKAGDKGEVGVASINPFPSFAIYNMENVVNILINDGRFDQAKVTVTNLIGQTLITEPLKNSLTQIDLNQFGKGIYVVIIHRGEEVFSKKVSFR